MNDNNTQPRWMAKLTYRHDDGPSTGQQGQAPPQDTQRSELMFYIFDQNNSGGGFIVDDEVTYNVIIEADSADEANRKAEEIGIYFDDDYEYDCSCCGTRWSRAWSDEGDETPEIYGKPVAEYKEYWDKDNEPWAYVYYKDGTKRSFIRGAGGI